MRPLSKWSSSTGVAALMAALLLVFFAVQSARADTDTDDPAITIGYSTTSIGTNLGSVSGSWSFETSATDGTVSFLINGANVTSLEVVGYYDPTGTHSFTAYVTPNVSGLAPGATEAFGNGSGAGTVAGTANGDTAIFNLSGTGIYAVPNGDYLVFSWTNWNTNGGAVLTGFGFGADGATPGTVPEPASVLLLGLGLVLFAGAAGLRRLKELVV